mgnify:CR=1 FL=1
MTNSLIFQVLKDSQAHVVRVEIRVHLETKDLQENQEIQALLQRVNQEIQVFFTWIVPTYL